MSPYFIAGLLLVATMAFTWLCERLINLAFKALEKEVIEGHMEEKK